MTFAVNFLLGSVLYLTVPSCVLPGSGALLAAFRAVSWGLLLAPATLQQAAAMLPHSGTLLLEGEGYILAAFFGLMIPLALFRRQAESDPVPKFGYGRAVLLNLKGSVLVAIVLAASAIYEAAEVIHMLRSAGRFTSRRSRAIRTLRERAALTSSGASSLPPGQTTSSCRLRPCP